MIKINLLPVREWRRREAVRRQISLLFLSTLLLFVTLFAVGVTYQQKLQNRRAKLRELEARKKQLVFVEKKIKEINAKRKELEVKFEAMERLQEGRTKTVQVLDDIVSAIPIDRVWLTSLKYSGSSVVLSGVALDNHTVALFMRRIQASPWFSSVKLTSTSLTRKNEHQLTNFALTITVVDKRGAKVKKNGKG